MGSTLYFSAFDAADGFQLWSISGTTANTATRLTSGNAINSGLSPSDLTAVGSTLYFTASDGSHGTQLWKSTGTTPGRRC